MPSTTPMERFLKKIAVTTRINVTSSSSFRLGRRLKICHNYSLFGTQKGIVIPREKSIMVEISTNVYPGPSDVHHRFLTFSLIFSSSILNSIHK